MATQDPRQSNSEAREMVGVAGSLKRFRGDGSLKRFRPTMFLAFGWTRAVAPPALPKSVPGGRGVGVPPAQRIR